MTTRLPFACLPNNEMVRVRAMFFDACDSDGYLFERDSGGLWCESVNYNGASTMDAVLEPIAYLMPHAVPRDRIGA